MHKRKHRQSNRDDNWEQPAHATVPSLQSENLDDPALDLCLYIQAHEADVIRGPPAGSARFLGSQDLHGGAAAGNITKTGLIRWGPPDRSGEADGQLNQPALWVDR